jgi:hypothetical protein
MRNKRNEGIKMVLDKISTKIPDDQLRFIVAEVNDLRKWTNCIFYMDKATKLFHYKKVIK